MTFLLDTEDTGMSLNELKTLTSSLISHTFLEEREEEQTECQLTEQDIEVERKAEVLPEGVKEESIVGVASVQTSEQIDSELPQGNGWDYCDIESTYRSCYGLRKVFDMVERTLLDSFKQLKNNFGVIGKCLWFFDCYAPSLRLFPEFNEFTDVYQYALAKFGIKKTTVCNLIRIYKEFCNTRGNLKSWYADYSISQLFEMLPLSYGEYVKIKPDWTIAQIREYKKSLHSVQTSGQRMFNVGMKMLIQESSTETVKTMQALPQGENHSDVGIVKSPKVEEIVETKEVAQVEEVTLSESQDTSGTVYVHFASEIEFTRWYYDNFDKLEVYPLTISYHVNSNSEEKE